MLNLLHSMEKEQGQQPLNTLVVRLTYIVRQRDATIGLTQSYAQPITEI